VNAAARLDVGVYSRRSSNPFVALETGWTTALFLVKRKDGNGSLSAKLV
jgi:hypothetical protein